MWSLPIRSLSFGRCQVAASRSLHSVGVLPFGRCNSVAVWPATRTLPFRRCRSSLLPFSCCYEIAAIQSLPFSRHLVAVTQSLSRSRCHPTHSLPSVAAFAGVAAVRRRPLSFGAVPCHSPAPALGPLCSRVCFAMLRHASATLRPRFGIASPRFATLGHASPRVGHVSPCFAKLHHAFATLSPRIFHAS